MKKALVCTHCQRAMVADVPDWWDRIEPRAAFVCRRCDDRPAAVRYAAMIGIAPGEVRPWAS